jgi:hypothetical protein
MTLKEKFIKESLDIRYQVLEPAKFEQIADDYAIEFAEWSVARAMGLDSFKLNNGELEIFKKEKDYE